MGQASPARSPLLKIVLIAAILLIAAVAALTYFFGGSALDSLVKTAIERAGTSTLGVQTTLSRAHVDLTGGRATLDTLRIANPKGFPSDRFLSIGSTDVGLDINSVQSDTIVLTHVKLSDITVNLEGSPGGMNYNAILDRLKKDSKPAEGPGKKFVIRTLELTNIKANVSVSPLPPLTVPIDRITLTDVGKDGLSASEVTQVVVQAILQGVARNGGGILPKEVLGDLTKGLSSLRDLGIDSLNELQRQLNSMLGNFLDDAGRTVKGLFDSIIPPKKDPPREEPKKTGK